MTKQTLGWNGADAHSLTRQRLWRYGPLLLWLAFISFASTSEFSAANTSQLVRPILLWLFPNLSEAQLATAHFLTRKAAHFTEFAVLAFLARRAFIASSYAFIRRYWFHLGLLLIVSYALLDEFHQSFVPVRTPSIYDSAIDIAGGLTVLLIFNLRDKGSEKGGSQATSLPGP
jgi:VanZ family protein